MHFPLLARSAWLALVAGCAGTQYGRISAAIPLPTDGSRGTTAATALPWQTIAPDAWRELNARRLAPVCDARSTPARADIAGVRAVQKVIDGWTAEKKKIDASEATIPQLANVDPAIAVTSFSFTCAGVDGASGSALEMNGAAHPFDLAWSIVTADPEGEPGVSVQAWSARDRKLYFGQLLYTRNDRTSTDGKAIITDISTYVPAGAGAPTVWNSATGGDYPSYETFFVTGKSPGKTNATGASGTQGTYFEVPIANGLSSGKFYAEVGRFLVGDDAL